MNPELQLSVVIPTHNRRSHLQETLGSLAEEAQDARFEVLVIDDGSTDDTLDLLNDLSGTMPFSLTALSQAPSGPAIARNRGVAAAKASIVLFLGDDTRPAPGTLKKHLDLHSRGHQAVQGRIDWDPSQEVTSLMDFLAPAGPQFYFKGLKSGELLPFTGVLGSNLSAPTAWLRQEPFDEQFPFAAVEDTEMAWRWYQRGWRATYSAEAICWHHHRYDDLDDFLSRQHRAGVSARHAVRRHPRLIWCLALQPALFAAWVYGRRWFGKARSTDSWDLACRRAFVAGFLVGRHEPDVKA